MTARKNGHNHVPEGQVSRIKAARLLGKDRRTVTRWVEQGELQESPEGFLWLDEVEELADAQAEKDDGSATNTALEVMGQGHRQATDHAERLVQLLEGPIKSALATVTSINTNLLNRLEKNEETQLEMMRVLGDHLLQKEEREAVREESAIRSESLRAVAKQVGDVVPLIMERMGKKDKLVNFLSQLDAEQRQGIGTFYHLLDTDEKKTACKEAFEALGIPIPTDPMMGEPDPEPEGEAAE